jgi:branched-chain amino acid transport system permease protein
MMARSPETKAGGPTPGSALKVERYTRSSRIALPVLGAIIVVAGTVPAWGSSNIMKQAVVLLTLIAMAQMWNLLAGYAGLVSVGQQAFIGIGAYSLWIFADRLHVQPYVCVLIAGVVAVAFALPTAGLAFRLRGGYFAVGTWVIAEAYKLVVINLPTSYLGSGSGVSINAAGRLARHHREAAVYWLALGAAVAAIAFVYLLLRSRRGLALTAIRDDETGARGLGVNVFRTKLWVFLVAAFGTGITGAVIYLNLLRVQPEAGFSLNYSALMIFAVVIGGLGTIEGPIIGAVIFFVLQTLLADYGSWYLILIGALAAGVVVFAPRGLWGLIVKRWPVDLSPVRRRLCLETVCLPPEESPPVSDPFGRAGTGPLPAHEGVPASAITEAAAPPGDTGEGEAAPPRPGTGED